MSAELVVQSGHRPPVGSVVFAPNGRTLASSERNEAVKLWDAATGECRRTLPAGSQMRLLFTPDGRHIITSGRGAVRLWDVAGGREAGRLTVQDAHLSHGVTCAAFSPDGRWFAASGWNKGYVWRFADVLPLFAAALNDAETACSCPSSSPSFPPPAYAFAHVGQAYALLFLPDNRTLIVGRGDYGPEYDGTSWSSANPAGTGKLDFHDAATGRREETFTEARLWPNCLAASADGRWLAVPQRSSAASVGGPPRCALYPHAPNNDVWDGGIWLLGVRGKEGATPAYSQILRGHSEQINDLAFSPDSSTLASSGDDKTLRLWSTATGECTRTIHQTLNPRLSGQARGINAVAYSPDGARLASGASDGVVSIQNAQTGAALHTMPAHFAAIRDCAFSPDGRRMAYSVADARWDEARQQYRGGLHCWDLDTGERWHQERANPETGGMTGHDRQHLLFSPNGATLAMIEQRYKHKDVQITLWDTVQGEERWTLGGVKQYAQFAFSADSLRLTGTIGHETWEWDATNGTLLRSARFRNRRDSVSDNGEAKEFAHQPNSAEASNSETSDIKVSDIKAGDIVVGTAQALSADGLTALCIIYEDAIRSIALVDVWTGAVLRRLMQIRHALTNCQFLADRRSVVVEISVQSRSQNEDDGDGGTAIWNLETGAKEEVLRGAHRITPVVASPNGRWIAALGEQGGVCLWERNASAPYRRAMLAPVSYPVCALAWHDNSNVLAGHDWRGSVYFWNAAEGALLATLTLLPSGADWLLAAASGDYDASPGTDAFLRWNVGGVLYPLSHLSHRHHRPDLMQRIFRSTLST